MLLSLIIVLVVLAIVCWIISIIPLPAGAPAMVRTIAYIIVAIIAIVYLLRVAGIALP